MIFVGFCVVCGVISAFLEEFLCNLSAGTSVLSWISWILVEKYQISGLAYLGWVELVLDRSKTARDVFVGKI